MKFLFGGSPALAGMLLTSSFLIFVPSSIAEPLPQRSGQTKQPQPSEPQKQNATGQETNAANPAETKTPASVNQLSGTEVITATSNPVQPAESAKPPVESAKPPAESANPATALTSGSNTAEPAAAPVMFSATAYSLYGRTASGVHVRKGIIAADRRILPIGSRVRVESGSYTGEYEVCDTGGAIRGKRIDVWVPSTREAMKFGRRNVKLTVLSYPKKAARVRSSKLK
jgi:3D (Asp-Asp-Asp) domain-containing protein